MEMTAPIVVIALRQPRGKKHMFVVYYLSDVADGRFFVIKSYNQSLIDIWRFNFELIDELIVVIMLFHLKSINLI